MNNEFIDIALYEKMLLGGLENLKKNEKIINDLNVFPVPDGDTGTNMRLTLESGISESFNIRESSLYFKNLSRGMLIGARGNSGVILSQIFKGINKKLKDNIYINSSIFHDALVLGYDYAYKSIENPVEGTMLTVLREGTNNVSLNNKESFLDYLKRICLSMKDILYKTPDMLQVLKDSNVVDSGGAGLLMIFEGMLNSFGVEEYTDLSLIKSKKNRYYKMGDHKPIAYITVCIGEKMKELYLDLGADIVITCNDTINASTNEFIEAINSANSDYIVIIPNNKNVYLSLNLAIEISKKDNVYIIDSKTMMEGYFALQMITRTSSNLNQELNNMKKGINDLISLEYAKSNKDVTYNGKKCNKNDYVCINNEEIVYSSNDLFNTITKSIENINLEEKEILVLIYNEKLDYDFISEIEEHLMNAYPNLEIGILDGGDMLYDVMIGIS